MDKKEKIKRSILIIIIVIIACFSYIDARNRRAKENDNKNNVVLKEEFTTDIIRVSYVDNTNFLISPYNIELALNLLKEGADGTTKEEIDKVLNNRKINDLSVKDRLNIANAIFIKDDYKNDVKESFMKILNDTYKADVLYDKFETPDVINNWVKEKTNGMIDKVIDRVNKDYVLGLASALALDVQWLDSFECNLTRSEEFTKADNNKINVEMMHKTYEYDTKYIKNDEVEGIVIPYQKEDDSNVELEFIALLPKTSVNDYINNLTKDKIDSLFNNIKVASSKYHINLSLPRFTYSYDIADFIEVLEKLGIKEAFDPVKANFKKMIELDENVYVGEAVHKTKIELTEKGTKAAAVTYFGMYKATAMIPDDFEEVNIKFNKPFIYMIREKNTGEILFFGSVFEPNKWTGSTCSN